MLKLNEQSGFTLVEIIFVFLILSVMTVVAVGQFTESNVELISGIEALKANLRYAQAQAMNTSDNWYVQFDTTTAPGTYTLYQSGVGAKTFPGEEDTTADLVSGMTITNGLVANFDNLGRPYTDTGGTTAQSGVRTIMTSAKGDITVNPGTGYIP